MLGIYKMALNFNQALLQETITQTLIKTSTTNALSLSLRLKFLK